MNNIVIQEEGKVETMFHPLIIFSSLCQKSIFQRAVWPIDVTHWCNTLSSSHHEFWCLYERLIKPDDITQLNMSTNFTATMNPLVKSWLKMWLKRDWQEIIFTIKPSFNHSSTFDNLTVQWSTLKRETKMNKWQFYI